MAAPTHSAQKENVNFQVYIIALGLVLLVIKSVAWHLTDSIAVFSDALESVVNVLAGSITLYSLYLSSLPRDFEHPYGHGKAEFISSAIEGTLISIAAILIVVKALTNIIEPEPLQNLDFGILLITITGIVNLIAGTLSVKKGKKSNSIALIAGGKHLLTDTYSTVGVVLALILVKLTDMAWLDTIISLIIALVIGYTGYKIIKQALAGMMDAADEELLNEVVEHICENRKNEWIDIHNFRIIKYGAVLHVDCHMTIPYYFDVEKAHEIVEELEEIKRDRFGDALELFVHIDPCKDYSCSICALHNCPVRKNEFIQQIPWTVENISKNKQHQLNR